MKNQKINRNKYEFSKIIVVFSAVVFVITLIVVFNAKMDFAANVTAVSATGSILLTTIVQYMKKSSSQNVRKIQVGYYKDAMQVRYQYNKKMIQLQQKYNVTKQQVSQIEYDSPMDQVTDNAFNDGDSKLQARADDAQSMPEIRNV